MTSTPSSSSNNYNRKITQRRRLSQRFSGEERDGVADSFARRGESEAQADCRLVTSEQRSSCGRRHSQHDRSHCIVPNRSSFERTRLFQPVWRRRPGLHRLPDSERHTLNPALSQGHQPQPSGRLRPPGASPLFFQQSPDERRHGPHRRTGPTAGHRRAFEVGSNRLSGRRGGSRTALETMSRHDA